MCSLDTSSRVWLFLNTHPLCGSDAAPWALHRGAQYSTLTEWIWGMGQRGRYVLAFPAVSSPTPFRVGFFLFSVLFCSAGSHLPQPLYIVCSLPFFAVAGSPALSASCPHISCPLSHGNHLCFLLAAYTFGLFDHLFLCCTSKPFCFDGWEILGQVTETCCPVLEALQAGPGQLPEAGQFVYILRVTLLSSCLGGLQLQVSRLKFQPYTTF